MPSQFTVLLEVKPYIKSYLLTLYGPREPIAFPKKSDYNKILIDKIGLTPKEGFKPDFKRLGKVEIVLPQTNRKNLQCQTYLSEEDREMLRKEIDQDFYSDCRAFIREKMRDGMSRKDATTLFMEVFNIQDEYLSFSSFYRDYNRQLQRRRLSFCKSE